MTADTTGSAGGPSLRYRARCPDCGWSQRFRKRVQAISAQDSGCPHCDRGVGVSRVRAASPDGGETCDQCGLPAVYEVDRPSGIGEYTRHLCTRHVNDPDEADMIDGRTMADGGREGWHACDYCGAEYRDPKAAIKCCSDRLVADGGLADVVADEFPVVSSEISDPDGATAYQVLATRVRPADHPRLERAGFHSPQTLYVLFSPGGRPLADYDPYKLANDAPGADSGWIVDQLRELNDSLRGDEVDRGRGVETDGGTRTAENGAEAETFYVYVCRNCEKVSGPKPVEASARVDRDIHNRNRHGGAPVAELESFEVADYVGRRPMDTPDFGIDGADGGDE